MGPTFRYKCSKSPFIPSPFIRDLFISPFHFICTFCVNVQWFCLFVCLVFLKNSGSYENLFAAMRRCWSSFLSRASIDSVFNALRYSHVTNVTTTAGFPHAGVYPLDIANAVSDSSKSPEAPTLKARVAHTRMKCNGVCWCKCDGVRFWKAVGSHVWRRTQCYATRVIWRDGSLAWLHLTSCTSTSINFYDRITGLSRVFMSGERPDLCTSRYLKCKVSQTCFPTTCVQPVGELPQESERKVPSFPVVAGLDFSPPDDVTKGYRCVSQVSDDTLSRVFSAALWDHLATAMFWSPSKCAKMHPLLKHFSCKFFFFLLI